MNLTSAEDWVKYFYPHASRPDLLILEYRQIQANTLRWAASLQHVGVSAENAILYKANQLDPDPKPQ